MFRIGRSSDREGYNFIRASAVSYFANIEMSSGTAGVKVGKVGNREKSLNIIYIGIVASIYLEDSRFAIIHVDGNVGGFGFFLRHGIWELAMAFEVRGGMFRHNVENNHLGNHWIGCSE